MINIIVTGGRNNNDVANVERCIKAFVKNKNYGVRFFLGDCRTGIDYIAQRMCDKYGFDYNVYFADWARFGRAAGPKRNEMMVDSALAATGSKDTVVCLSFSGGRGTKNCTRYAAKKGARVIFA